MLILLSDHKWADVDGTLSTLLVASVLSLKGAPGDGLLDFLWVDKFNGDTSVGLLTWFQKMKLKLSIGLEK
jgi:hypothetical protein